MATAPGRVPWRWGGTDTARAQSPLEAMGDNLAGLGFLNHREFDLGGLAAIPQGKTQPTPAAPTGSA